MAISGVSGMAGDDAVLAATGRRSEEWFELLAKEGADGWPHPRIARWLVDEHAVDGWWAQNLTVRYEQATGRRQPGQQADGTFAAGSSRAVPATREGAFEAVVDAAGRELGIPPRTRRAHELRPNARWSLADGATVVVAVEPLPGRIRIGVMFEKLADGEAAATAKERAARILAAGLDG